MTIRKGQRVEFIREVEILRSYDGGYSGRFVTPGAEAVCLGTKQRTSRYPRGQASFESAGDGTGPVQTFVVPRSYLSGFLPWVIVK